MMTALSDDSNKVRRLSIRDWYRRYERPLSSISLVGGFAFDALTLTRADQFRESFWIIVHLAAVAACIVLINREPTEPEEDAKGARTHFWLTNVLQFFLGGLLSTYIVFYFRSATLAASWPFMLILVGAFVANDRLRKHRERLVFQAGMFFLSVYVFFIFILPVVLHNIGTVIFLMSGGLSILTVWGLLVLLERQSRTRFQRDRSPLIASIAAIFICVNAMYFSNLIPPLPLSLKDGRAVHGVSKNGKGEYFVRYENQGGGLGYFNIFEDFHEAPGDTVFAWSAVFSPPALNLTIVHEWQFYDEKTRQWTTKDRIPLRVIGGRDGGFRTYSTKRQPAPGVWRVNIETEHGAVIGRIRFRVVPVRSPVPLETETSNSTRAAEFRPIAIDTEPPP